MASYIIIKMLLFIVEILVHKDDKLLPGDIIRRKYKYYDLLSEAKKEMEEIADGK
jgi:hypothetical protein